MADRANKEDDSLTARPGDGGFQARLRLAWINNSPRFYAKMVPGQKRVIDKLVELRLEEFQEHLAGLDRNDSTLAYDLAELSAQVVQMIRLLESIDRRLARLEAMPTGGEEPPAPSPGGEEAAAPDVPDDNP